jgi:hypothetical protein
MWLISVLIILMIFILYKSQKTHEGMRNGDGKLYFGDIVICDDFYGIVINQSDDLFVFGKDNSGEIMHVPAEEFIKRGRGKIEVRRAKYKFCDNDKRRVQITAQEYLQKCKKNKYGEYRALPPVIFVQQILIDAGLISYYNGGAFQLADSQDLYFGPELDSRTLNMMPLHMLRGPVLI